MLVRGDINSYSMENATTPATAMSFWALLAVSLVRHKDNKPLYFIAQIEDINDLKQSEQENQRLMERIHRRTRRCFRKRTVAHHA
ncbi:PAS domain S-box protein [Salmonella enterica subsp. enterica serovar Senftenberg]|nr:PAS domain S-box protein [Salmonella enterica subsp. enterica serovar Senftenberg]